MLDLKGKVAIVSGANQGIGTAIAKALAAHGASVVAFDNQEGVVKLAEEIASGSNKNVIGLVADVSLADDCKRVVDYTLAEFGGIDILINNAATYRQTPVTASWEQTVADWDYIMDTNIKGVLMLSRLCIPELKARGGDIVNMSTYYVLPARSRGTNSATTDLYNASKWALNGFTDAWSKVLRKYSIRVNGLCMGATDTPMLRSLFDNNELPGALVKTVMQPEAIAQQLIDLLGDGRTGENIGAWIGSPIEIPLSPAPHRLISG
ncbi:MAG: SDR family oxidoreductase [bacterium]|nr:SDR family oxidoreductase [Gammaproteobacteria bacterium]